MCAAHMVPVLRPLMPQAAHMAAFAAEQHPDDLPITPGNARRIIDMAETARQGGAGRAEVRQSRASAPKSEASS